MTSVSIEEAKINLRELIHQLAPGEEIVITENNLSVAKLVSNMLPSSKQRMAPGLGKGMITIVNDDDEHLREFSEFMP